MNPTKTFTIGGGGSGSTTIGSTATEMFAYSSISDFLSLNDNLLAEAIRNGATAITDSQRVQKAIQIPQMNL